MRVVNFVILRMRGENSVISEVVSISLFSFGIANLP